MIDRQDGKQFFCRYVEIYITKIHLEDNGFFEGSTEYTSYF